MKQTAVFSVAAAAVLLLVIVEPALAQFYFDSYELPEKKSSAALSDFTSALNGAARLRYGKRSAPSVYSIDPQLRDVIWLQAANKRAPSADKTMPQFLESLNGAERLRFG
uniref:Serine protease n=1 Tax=Panagrellus redivivus TaxID=6233 RepID=A0A7E4VL78_PANRE